MSRWISFVVVVLAIAGLVACGREVAVTPAATASAPVAKGASSSSSSAAATTAPGAEAPHPTPTPTVPRPPLTQDLRPANWLEMPAIGGGDEQLVFAVLRGMVFDAALHPTKPLLALARPGGVYLCSLPTVVASDALTPGVLDCQAFLPHSLWAGTVVFTPDGDYLLSTDSRERLLVWDLRSDPPQLVTTTEDDFLSTNYGTGQIIMSPDGRYLATLFYGLDLWEVKRDSWRFIHITPPEVDEVGLRQVVFSPDGTQLAGLGWRGSVAVLDLENIRDGWTVLQEEGSRTALSLGYVPRADGLWLAAVTVSYHNKVGVTVDLWGPHGEHETHQVGTEYQSTLDGGSKLSQRYPQYVIPGPEGTWMIPAAHSQIYQVEPETLNVVRTFKPNFTSPKRLIEMAYRPDDDLLVAVWENGSVHIWNPTTSDTLRGAFWDVGDYPIRDVFFDPLGRFVSFLVKAGDGGMMGVLDWRLQSVSMGYIVAAQAMFLTSSGCHQLFYERTDLTVRVLNNLCTMLEWPPGDFDPPLLDVLPVSVPATDWVALVSWDEKRVTVWDPFTGTQVYALDVEAEIGTPLSLAVSADSRRLFVSGTENRIGVWDAITGEHLTTWTLEPPPRGDQNDRSWVTGLATSADGRSLVALRMDGFVLRLDPETGERQAMTTLNKLFDDVGYRGGTIRRFILSPDGRFLYLSTWITSWAAVFDLEDDDLVVFLPLTKANSENGLDVSPDGRFLARGGGVGNVAIYDVMPWFAPRLGQEQVLPLPVPPEMAETVSSFHSEYQVVLRRAEEEHSLLDVETQSQRTPRNLSLYVSGLGWPLSGEIRWDQEAAVFLFRSEPDAPEHAIAMTDVPPSYPMLRGWPWAYQGVTEEGLYRYTSTTPWAAVLPPFGWLRRALDATAASFTPTNFEGEVLLNADGVLVAASLTWEGELWADGETQPAQIEVRYQATDFNQRIVSPAEDAATDDTASADDTVVTTDGVPLPPGSVLLDPEEELYIASMGTDELLAWYAEVLPQHGFVIEAQRPKSFGDTPAQALWISRDADAFILYLIDQDSITVVAVRKR